jgi:hypothetical protein
MKKIDILASDYKTVHRRWSYRISAGGAIGGFASALALAGGAAAWANVIPLWAVFTLGGVICAASLVATYIKQGKLHGPDHK